MFKKKLLFVVYGYAFRQDKSTLLGRDYSISDFEIEAQKICCDSHNKLIKFIKDKYDIEVDVQLITYTYDDACNALLLNNYNPKYIKYIAPVSEAQKYNRHATPKRLPQHYIHSNILFNEEYDYVFAVRIDLAFKIPFFSNFKLSEDKIILPSPNDLTPWKEDDTKTHRGNKSIVDHFFLIPKMYFDINEYFLKNNLFFGVYHDFIRIVQSMNYKFKYDFFDYVDWRANYLVYWSPAWYVPGASYGRNIDGDTGTHYTKTKRNINNLDTREPIIITKQECEHIDKDIILPIKKYTQSELNELWSIAINNNWVVNRKIKDVFTDVLDPKHIKAVGKKISYTYIGSEVIEDISFKSLLHKDNNGIIRCLKY